MKTLILIALTASFQGNGIGQIVVPKAPTIGNGAPLLRDYRDRDVPVQNVADRHDATTQGVMQSGAQSGAGQDSKDSTGAGRSDHANTKVRPAVPRTPYLHTI